MYPALIKVSQPPAVERAAAPPPKRVNNSTRTPQAAVDPTRTAEGVPEERAQSFIVAGWLPFWDIDEGIRVVREFPGALDEISPFWYQVADDGRIERSSAIDIDGIVRLLRTMGKRISPTISGFDGTRTGSMLNDAGKRAFHIERIVELVTTGDYESIDIDYESLHPEDRDAFSHFIRELSAALHAHDKKLTTTVHAKTFFPGSPGSSMGHDYLAIGEASDLVRIMAYDQHYRGGPAGPVASLAWVTKVVDYAVSKIPPEKIVLGIPAFGYDWPANGGQGKSIVHDDVAALSLAKGARILWDERAQTPYFNYQDGEDHHIVWFENYASLAAKVKLARRRGLGGIVIWRLGREDKQIYKLLSAY